MASQTQNPHSTTVQPQPPSGSRNNRFRQTQNSVCARALPHRFTAHATPVQSSWITVPIRTSLLRCKSLKH